MNRRTRYIREKKRLIPIIRTLFPVYDKRGRISKEYLSYSNEMLQLHLKKYDININDYTTHK